MIVPILVILLLVGLNGLFVAAEFAIIGVRPTQLRQMSEAGNRSAARMLGNMSAPRRQDRYIATAQLGITLASLGLGMYGEPHLAHFVEPYLARWTGASPDQAILQTAGYLIAISVLTYLHTVAGEMVPKSLALSARLRTALAVSWPMALFQALFHFPVSALNGLSVGLLRLLRVPPALEAARLHSPEELEQIVEESAQLGLIEAQERELIRNIFDFGERTVGQVMTSRLKIQAVPRDARLPEIRRRFAETRFSRLLVYEGSLDNLLGSLDLKDLVRRSLRDGDGFDIRLLLRPVPAVPEQLPIENLLRSFRQTGDRLAVVLDEFGGTAGIVTLGDLVEEVVGEVQDEFDSATEPVTRSAAGVFEVDGTYLLDDLREQMNLEPEGELEGIETVSGLVMARLGRLPIPGDQVPVGEGARLTVLRTDGFAVSRARIEFAPATPEGQAGR